MTAARYHSNYVDSMLKILGQEIIFDFRKDNQIPHNIISNHELFWRVTHYKSPIIRNTDMCITSKKMATIHKDTKNLQINNTITQ